MALDKTVRSVLLEPSLGLEQGIQVLEKNARDLDANLSGQLCRRAHVFINKGDYVTAETQYRWAVFVCETISSAKGIASCSYDLAELLENAEKPLDAVDFYRKAQSYYLDRGELSEVGKIYHRMAMCFKKAGRFDSGVAILDEATKLLGQRGLEQSAHINFYPLLLELRKASRGQKDTDSLTGELRQAQANLDRAESVRPQFEEAMKLQEIGRAKQALSLYRETEPVLVQYGDLRDQASLCLNMGGVLSDMADYHEATARLRKAVSICHETGDKQGEAATRKTLASNLEDYGDYQGALTEYRRALRLYEDLGEMKAIARTLNETGVTYKNLNRHIDAFRCYLGARYAAMNASATDTLRGVMANLDTLVSVLRRRFSPALAEEAERLFNRGRLIELGRLLDRGYDQWSRRSMSALVSSGPTASQLAGVRSKGKRGAQELLALARSYAASGEIQKTVEELWAAATTYWQAAGNPELALDLFHEVGQLCETHGLHHDLIHIGQQMGECLLDAKRPDEAADILMETIEESKRRDAFPVLWKARHNLAQAHAVCGRPAEAREQLSLATQEIEERAKTLHHVKSVDGFLADKAAVYQRLVDLLIDDGDEKAAYDVVLRAKSWTLVRFFQRIRSAGPTRLDPDEQAAIARAKELTQKEVSADAEKDTRAAAEWLLASDELRIWEEACERNWMRVSADVHHPVDSQGIGALLVSGDLMLDFFFTETRLHVFLITAGRIDHLQFPVTQQEFFGGVSQVDFVRKCHCNEGDAALLSVSNKIRDWLSPLYDRLRDEAPARLCLCPHGILHMLPVASALLEGVPRGLRRRRAEPLSSTMWHVPHATFFASSEERLESPELRYYGVGNPDGTLENAAGEVAETSRFFREENRDIKIDTPVSREDVFQRMARADVVHFACHGVLRDDLPELSFLKLGHSEHLRVNDILAKGHTSARLVVLSACWTSVGRVSTADEITSLARSFLYVGASAVLATLWAIPDKPTKDFICTMFQHWVKLGQPLREAYRLAREEHAEDPLVTSSFVLLEV